jgi:hypothetical protein
MRPATVFYCSDDRGTKEKTAARARDIGYEPVNAGPLSSARFIEPLAGLGRHARLRCRHGDRHSPQADPALMPWPGIITAEVGTSVLLMEEDVDAALRLAQRAYVMETGRIVAEGTGEQLLNDPRVREAYLGVA